MADSPSKLEDAETGDKQSPENEGIMEHGGEGAFADFEVKEQDRWLPIANGEWSWVSLLSESRRRLDLCSFVFPIYFLVWFARR